MRAEHELLWRRTRSGLHVPVRPIAGGADWPLSGGGERVESGVDSANSGGVAVTAGGSTHTKGAYAQLIASVAAHGTWLTIEANAASTSNPFLIDIAVGGAGSEQVVLPNVLVRGANTSGTILHLPFLVPAGARLSARCQNATPSAALRLAAQVHAGDFAMVPFGRAEAVGALTASSTGTTITASGSANTKGAWTQLIASTAFRYRWLLVSLVNAASQRALFDIGIGGAGSEVVILPDLSCLNQTAGEAILHPVDVPAGSALSARMAVANALGQTGTCAAIGIG